MPEFEPGDVFVDHRIEGLAGRGGMGVVYRATQLGLDRLVALKVITPALAQEPDFRERFVAESKAAASIEHPNVIPVYYTGEREGVLFIVMRYVDGPDLRALVRADGALDAERAAHIVAQVGAGLDAAHAHGLVHRDVKPANVLLGPGEHAYLTDFGLTKRVASSGGVSRAGGWVGTLGYVAPEQIRGGHIDARTDVYALGCLLVYTLTGQAPYQRDSDEATLWAHLNSPPPSEAVPPEFEAVVARALAKDPSDRYPSAGDLGRAALAAAGRSAAPGPERNVARGAAAPAGLQEISAETVRRPPAGSEGETRPSPPADGGERMTAATASGGAPPAAPRSRRAAGAGAIGGRAKATGAAVAVVAVIALALVVLLPGGKEAARPRAVTPPPAQPATPVAGPVIDVSPRPNALAFAGGGLWVLSGGLGELQRRDPVTGKKIDRRNIGGGGKSLAPGFRSVWVVKGLVRGTSTRTLLRFNARTGRRILPATQIAAQGNPVVVAAGEGAVWVGVRSQDEGMGDETVVKIDPSSLGKQPINVPGGVQDIAVGEGALWVSNRFRRSVLRIDVASGAQKEIEVGGLPLGIAIGEGAAWVATKGDDTITRIGPRGGTSDPIELDYVPTRVVVGGGSVWATARDAGRLIRVDPDRREVVADIATGQRPFALDVTAGKAVWVTLLNEDAIQRVAFGR